MSEPSPSRARTILGLVGGALLLVLVLVLAVLSRLRSQVREVARELTAEYQALAVPSRHRPSHVHPPTPGTFVQGFASEYAHFAVSEWTEAHTSGFYEKCVSLAPEDLQSALPPSCEDWLREARAPLRILLGLSHAEDSGGSIEDLRVFEPLSRWWAVEPLVAFAPVETRFQLQSGQTDAAVETCLDTLALGRDLGLEGGFIGLQVSARAYREAFQPCRAALARVSLPRLLAAAESLRLIREGWRPLSFLLHKAHVWRTLGEACSLLSSEERARLLPSGRPCKEYTLGFADPRRTPRDEERHAFIQWHRYLRQLESLADLPPTQRTPRLQALEEHKRAAWNPIFARLLKVPDDELFESMDLQRAQLELLLALTWARIWRAEHGAWPSQPPDFPPPPGLRPIVLKSLPGPRGTLDLVEPETALRLRVSPESQAP